MNHDCEIYWSGHRRWEQSVMLLHRNNVLKDLDTVQLILDQNPKLSLLFLSLNWPDMYWGLPDRSL